MERVLLIKRTVITECENLLTFFLVVLDVLCAVQFRQTHVVRSQLTLADFTHRVLVIDVFVDVFRFDVLLVLHDHLFDLLFFVVFFARL